MREVRALDGVVTAEDEDGVSHALGAPCAFHPGSAPGVGVFRLLLLK
jgi:hypothetical protein